MQFLGVKVPRVPADINLGLGIGKLKFLGIPDIMLFCIFHNILFLFFFGLFRAVPVAYESSQARG